MAKPIRIIGFPDNQRPDMWSSTVYTVRNTLRQQMKPNGVGSDTCRATFLGAIPTVTAMRLLLFSASKYQIHIYNYNSTNHYVTVTDNIVIATIT